MNDGMANFAITCQSGFQYLRCQLLFQEMQHQLEIQNKQDEQRANCGNLPRMTPRRTDENNDRAAEFGKQRMRTRA